MARLLCSILLLGCWLSLSAQLAAGGWLPRRSGAIHSHSRRPLQQQQVAMGGGLAAQLPAPEPAAFVAAPAPAPGVAAAAPPAPVINSAAATTGSCQRNLNFSTVFMPPQAQFLYRLYVNGTRNYTCQTFTLQFGPPMALSRTTGAYNCIIFYPDPFTGIIDCSDTVTGQNLGKIVLDTTVQGAVFVQPAPIPNSEPWGRFKMETTGDLPNANYLVRYNSSGGAPPGKCTAPRGEWVLVPYTDVLDLYYCP